MTEVDKIERGYSLFQEAIHLVQNEQQFSSFESLLENLTNLSEEQAFTDSTTLSAEKSKRLTDIYRQLEVLELDAEEKRRILQLTFLTCFKEEPLQANHQLTPDSIGFLFAYLLEQLFPNKKQALTILDPAAGTGNLLFTVAFYLQSAGYSCDRIAIEPDHFLASVCLLSDKWYEGATTIYARDAIQTLVSEKADVVVSDLPIGYYSDDDLAQKYCVHAQTGHTYAHHLLMEHSMQMAKDSAFGLFLVPSHFLDTEQTANLKKWLSEKVYLQGILNLPENLFKDARSRKSIIIVQNRGVHTHQVKEVLVADLISLRDSKTIQRFFKQFQEWKKINLDK